MTDDHDDRLVRLGLYRLLDPLLGEAARVDKAAGDAAPYLNRYLYELLEFSPEFDSLPTMSEYERLIGTQTRARQALRRHSRRELDSH